MTSFANMPPQDEVEVEESDNASENEYETKDERDEESMPDASIKSELGANGGEGPDVKKPKLDPKDPLRPRRKKARRACFACQRAHLTCGMFQTLRVLSSARFIKFSFSSWCCRRYHVSCTVVSANITIMLHTDIFLRRRTSLPTLYKARACRPVPGWRQKEGQVSS